MSSPIQMQLYFKPTIFSDFFLHFWNRHQILHILKKKVIVIAPLFRKLQTVTDLVRPLFKKQRFRNPFDNQHFKESQALVKSASEQFHHIFSSPLGDRDFEKISVSDVLNLRGVS